MLAAGFVFLIIASVVHCWYAANHAARSDSRAMGYYAFGKLTLYLAIVLLSLGVVLIWLSSTFLLAFAAVNAYFLLLPFVFLPVLRKIYKPESPRKVSDAEWERIAGLRDTPTMTPNANTIWTKLFITLQEASDRGDMFADVNAGELHRKIGGYPGPNHRMPVCCRVMREEMRPGDTVLQEPTKGVGASLTIRYKLPRSGTEVEPNADFEQMKQDAEQFFDDRDEGVRLLADSEPIKADSQFALGSFYEHGMPNLPKDAFKALWWYKKAADQNHAEAKIRLLELYYYGDDVPQDYEEASSWAQKAAEQGDAYGQLWLASFYEKGNGVKQDYSQAARWYREAANGGLPNAKWSLGLLHKAGLGVPADNTEAYFWQSLAIAEWASANVPVNESYATECDQTGLALTKAECSVVRRRVEQWIAEQPIAEADCG